eukprot:scaffold4009_cov124-Cylindrotheca_fusiformis.AAC.25
MESNKKRSADSGGFNDDNSSKMAPTRRNRLKVTSPDPKRLQNSKFLQNKKSLWQQGMEKLNEETRKILNLEKRPTVDQAALIAREYLRVARKLTKNYNPKPGQLVALGNDDCFQLGIAPSADADKQTEYPPTFVNTVGNKVVQIAGGGLHSVVATEDGQVYTFGCNDDFALGREEKDESKLHLVNPVTRGFKDEDYNQIIAVDAGDSHSLFLSITGNVYQCGMYKDGDSGKFHDVAFQTENPKGSNKHPVLVPLPKPAGEIFAGPSFNAAILIDGSLYTWGMGQAGQLARSKHMGATMSYDKDNCPTYDLGKMFIGEHYETDEIEKDIAGNIVYDEETGKEKMVMGYRYFQDVIRDCFLKPSPVCWAVPLPKRSVISVACGELFMLVVARDDGFASKVYSSGHSGYGQLGHGDTRARHELTSIKALEEKMISKVAAGTAHALALGITGRDVYGWGRADYGQVGHSVTVQAGDIETSPQQIAFPSTLGTTLIRDIAAGPSVSMAISEENDVYTWGFDESGATGHNIGKDILRPKKLDVLEKGYGKRGSTNCHVLNAAGGGQHSLMIIERLA